MIYVFIPYNLIFSSDRNFIKKIDRKNQYDFQDATCFTSCNYVIHITCSYDMSHVNTISCVNVVNINQLM